MICKGKVLQNTTFIIWKFLFILRCIQGCMHTAEMSWVTRSLNEHCDTEKQNNRHHSCALLALSQEDSLTNVSYKCASYLFCIVVKIMFSQNLLSIDDQHWVPVHLCFLIQFLQKLKRFTSVGTIVNFAVEVIFIYQIHFPFV